MNMTPKTRVYCISLANSANRHGFASNASRYSVNFDFFEAVSVDDLRHGKAVAGCKIDITNLAWTLHERADPRRQRAPLLFTEIGCAYSHILCWQRAKRADADYLVVFEDDAVMCRSLDGIAIPPNADMLYISNRMPRNSAGEAVGYRGSGTEGYVLSRAGITKCLEIFSVLYMPLDLQLIAHQRSMQGLGLSQYRRTLSDDLYLNAYVTPQPYCFHPVGSSQVHKPAFEEQMPGINSLPANHEIGSPEIPEQKVQPISGTNKPVIFGASEPSSASPGTSPGRSPPKVSLVICSRNRAGQLAAMLDRLDLADLTRNVIEVNLVDSASTDSTYQVMCEFRNKNSFPVNVAQSDRPGLNLARNAGIKVASGDVFVFTDDDCYVGADYFTNFSMLWDGSAFQYGGGQILMYDDSLDPRVACMTIGRRQDIPPDRILAAGSVQGANMFFAREVFEQAGLFNENMGWGTPFACGDIEMATRASMHGFRGVLLPELKVLHDHGRKRGSPEANRTVEGYDFGRGAYYASLVVAGYLQRSKLPNMAKLPREIEGAQRYFEAAANGDGISRLEVEPGQDRPRHPSVARSTTAESISPSESAANASGEVGKSPSTGITESASNSSRSRYNERQVSSALLDQPVCQVRDKVFICSTPRTGSNLLCRAMIHHGIGIPHEYFHFVHAAIIGPRVGIDALQNGWLLKTDAAIRQAYIKEVMDRRTVNGVFSAKVQWWEFAHFLNNSEGIELFRNGHFLYLYREDLLAQAISLHISYQTGRWGFDDLVTSEPSSKPNFMDNESINKYLLEISAHDMAWRRFFARNRISPLAVSYESLIGDTGGVVRSMVESFGLAVSSTDFGYAEEHARDPRLPPVSEIKANFLNAYQRVFQAPQAAIKTSGNAALTEANVPAPEAGSPYVQPDAKID